MTSPVHTVKPQDTLETAANDLRRFHISGFPVIDGDHQVVGVLSEKDIAVGVSGSRGIGEPKSFLDLLLEGAMETDSATIRKWRARLPKLRVQDVMTSPAICLGPTATVSEAAELMRSHRINRLPIVEGQRLIGIISRGDIVSVLAEPFAPPERIPVEPPMPGVDR